MSDESKYFGIKNMSDADRKEILDYALGLSREFLAQDKDDEEGMDE